jgi:signal transduction histidine kinase
MKILAEKRDITLVFSDMADIEKFYFDPDKVKQVLINLLSNAIKFSNPESKVCVQTEDSDRFALIKVIDQGIGIHPDDQEKIFEKYYLVNSARRMDASTGIGLSLCKQIVEFHGGSIWVKSKPGKGSLFGFSLLKRTDLSDKDSSFKITP